MFMKMNYDALLCEISLVGNFYAVSHVPCEYENNVIGHAVCCFTKKSNSVRRHCVFQSWKLCACKGKNAEILISPILFLLLLLNIPDSGCR